MGFSEQDLVFFKNKISCFTHLWSEETSCKLSLSQFRMKFFNYIFKQTILMVCQKLNGRCCKLDTEHTQIFAMYRRLMPKRAEFDSWRLFVIPWYFCEFLSLLFPLQVEDDQPVLLQPGLRQPGLHQALTRGLLSFPVHNTHGLLTFLDPTITSPSVLHVPPWPVNLVDSSTNRDHVGHSIWATRLPIVRQISAASLRSVFVV